MTNNPQNNNEINNYQKRGFIKNLPFGVKATFIKYWFYGAIYFFCFMGLGIFLKNETLIIVTGLIGGVLFDIALYNIYLLFADSREEASKWWVYKSKKIYSMLINIAVVMAVFFAFYFIVVPIKKAMPKNSSFWWVFQEPITAAILLTTLDTGICWAKNLIIKLFKYIFRKSDEEVKEINNYINILDISSVSVTFELNNKSCYYSNKPYNILLDNEIIFKKVNNNVYTIFDLKPDTKYKLSINKISKEFITPKISKFYKCFEGNNLQNVIDEADQYSLIIVNKGTYKVDTLKLKNNITLYFRKGAIIEPINNKLKSIIKLDEIKDTKIISEGVINGDGLTNLVSIYNSSNICLIGAGLNNFKDCGLFTFHSYKINLLNLNIDNKTNSATAIKLDRCANINIIGSTIKNNKDGISINFNTDKEDDYIYGYRDYELRNLNIENCGEGISINGEHHSVVSEVHIINSKFNNINNAICINSNSNNIESTIKDISISNIDISEVQTPFIVDINNINKTNKRNLSIEERNKIPYFDNIVFNNVNVKDYHLCAGYINGLNEKYLGAITFMNSSFASKKDAKEGNIYNKKYCKNGFIVNNVKTFALKNVGLTEVIGRKIDANNVSEVIDDSQY